MAEPGLSLAKTDLDALIGFSLGYGRTSGNWGTSEQADIDDARDMGLARFYDEHDWFFMSPTTTLDTTADDYDQDLPDGFGWLVETFYYAADIGYSPLVVTSPGEIRRRIAASSSSGVMTHCAINPKSTTGSSGQRWEVLFYPPPDDAYTLTYRYRMNRDALSTSYPYPAGGTCYRNAILYACLAAGDSLIKNQVGQNEEMYQVFLSQCRRMNARQSPINLGYNGDPGFEDDVLPRTNYCYYEGAVGT